MLLLLKVQYLSIPCMSHGVYKLNTDCFELSKKMDVGKTVQYNQVYILLKDMYFENFLALSLVFFPLMAKGEGYQVRSKGS